MKKRILFGVCGVAVLALASCTQESIENDIPQDGGEKFSFIATIANPESGTKTAIADNSGVLKSTWVEGDEVGLYWYLDKPGDPRKGENLKATAQSSGESCLFETNYAYLYEVASKYPTYAYYPYSSGAGDDRTAVPFTVPELQKQSSAGNTDHLSKTDVLFGHSSPNGQGYTTTKDISVTFKHALTVLSISLSSSAEDIKMENIYAYIDDDDELFSVSKGTVNLETGVLTPTEGSNRISLKLSTPVALSSTPQTFYMQITPGHAGKKLVVRGTVNGIDSSIGSADIPAGGIPAGVNATLSFNVSGPDAVEYTDLSTAGTANTYLITKPGHYKFKATVKGNGTIPTQLASVAGGSEIAPKSALLLWYNTRQTSNEWVDASPVNVLSVKLQDGYVHFSTPIDFTPGNVVIAAFAEEGLTYDNITVDDLRCFTNATMLWSWNIWAAKDYDPSASPMVAGEYQIMNRNLGAIIDGRDATGDYDPANAVGNYYQWGRKDPFPAFDNYATYSPCVYTNKLLATPTYTPVTALQINNQGVKNNLDAQMFGYGHNEGGSVDVNNSLSFVRKGRIFKAADRLDAYADFAVNNPHIFIGAVDANSADDLGNYNWYYKSNTDSTFQSLWGDPDSGADRTVVKSLYDPCPVGWRVMGHDVIEALGIKAAADTVVNVVSAADVHGFMFKGSYIPFSGQGRWYSSMRIDNVKSSGVPTVTKIWNASASDGLRGYWYPGHVHFEAPANYTSGSFVAVKKNAGNCGAQGMSVRCVKE